MESSLPPSGQFLQAIRGPDWDLEDFGIGIDDKAIKDLLLSDSFTQTFERLSADLLVTLPLNFSTAAAELNVISIVSLLNFASGYRMPLRNATGRGAWDNIRYLVIAMYIDSTTGAGDLLSAKGMKLVDEQKISDLLNVSIHEEKPHESIPGVTVGQLGGPIYELVLLIKRVLNETGTILAQNGYPDLGSFVKQSFNEGAKDPDNACSIIVERLVTMLPAMRDMTTVDGKKIYVFKKALFLTLAITKWFEKQDSPPLPLPDVSNLPAMSDNVIPSMLVYFGIVNLGGCKFFNLRSAFPEVERSVLLKRAVQGAQAIKPEDLKEGPLLGSQEAFVLRAAGVTACDRMASIAEGLGKDAPRAWMSKVRPSQLDMWLWSVAKDRTDYRILPRFAERNTVFY